MFYYTVRHHTRYHYSTLVGESVMEVRMEPRSDDRQRCFSFDLKILPSAHLQAYEDHLHNKIHFFDIPQRHNRLVLRAQSLVGVESAPPLPEALDPSAWAAVDALAGAVEHWDNLAESHFVRFTPMLAAMAADLRIDRHRDPLSTLRHINTSIYSTFSYVPESTTVDSPIDVALANRSGVCQDYAHIMIALARRLGIPCRYVSGYLFHQSEGYDQSAEDASHAWVEAFLPDLGWIGFDPTNNLTADERHIRVAIGRDYDDVPPTRGLFKGDAESKMQVGVQVTRADRPEPEKELLPEQVGTTDTGGDAAQQQQQ